MNLVDSSGWIEFFVDGPGAEFFADPISEEEGLVVPTICLTEVFRFVLREQDETAALQAIAVMQRGEVVGLGSSLALYAARLGLEHSLPLADSIVYAIGQSSGATVWTQDSDFKGLSGVQFRPKSRRR